jgi:hypothetical protein
VKQQVLAAHAAHRRRREGRGIAHGLDPGPAHADQILGSIKQITRHGDGRGHKLRRFQSRAVTSRPFAVEIVGLLQRLAGSLGAWPSTPLPAAARACRRPCPGYLRPWPVRLNLLRELERWVAATLCGEFFVFGRKGQYVVSAAGRSRG